MMRADPVSVGRIKELTALLDKASRAYYDENREIMSNFTYDALYDELEALENETGIRLANSPTLKVGYAVAEQLRKVTHDTPMLSLDKTKDVDKFAAFLGDRDGLLSWKLDGLKIILKYGGGQLQQAVTRGNGVVGEDVTHTARVFCNLPLTIPHREPLTLQGEAVIGYADFERINAALTEPDEKYKNPRNLCSGTIRQLNSAVAAKRQVQFYAFGLLDGGDPAGTLRSQQLAWLVSQGFSVVEHEKVTRADVPAAVKGFQDRIAGQDIATDGLVLAFDDIAYGASLGATSKFPRDSLAFKWADETCETRLLRVEWNTSRTGLINPVAVFEPVEIEGSVVNRASLHNVSIVRALALGEGDLITVYKANMIIPQVAENLTRSDTVPVPETCPVCRAETEIVPLREGEALYCLNPNCKAQLLCGLTHFAGRDAMNVEGLSEQTLEKFMERGFIKDYTDLFTLARHEADILTLDGFGRKSFDNLTASIERSKDTELPNFIYALGVKHVGLSNAKLLCRQYGYDMEKIIAAAQGDTDELLAVKGFGKVIVRSLRVYFRDKNNLTLMRKVLPLLRLSKPETEEKTLLGLTFVITGDLRRFDNRKALQDVIERRGGRVTGSVTANTSYLINNDADSPSSKNKKAAGLGVPILTEDAFLERMDAHGLHSPVPEEEA